MFKKLVIAAGLLAAASAPAWSQAGQFPAGFVQGNATASAGLGKPSTVTAILDRALGSTRGSILERGASGWVAIGPGSTAGLPFVSAGTGADPLYQRLGIVGGGTNCAAASGTCLDNITGFASTGLLNRTGAGAYAFVGLPLSISNGGTGAGTQAGAAANVFPTPTRAGDVVFWNGSAWVTLAGNNSGTNCFQENASGVPSFGSCSVGSGTVTEQKDVAGTGLSQSGNCDNTTTNAGSPCTFSLSTPVSAANGGSGVTSPTAHTLPINEGGSAQNNTGTGTTGQAVVSNGGSADPTFQSGVWVLLNTLTASNSATISDTTHFTSTYNEYELVFENIIPATTATTCEIQVQSGGTFQTTTYLANEMHFSGGTAVTTAQTTFVPCSGSGGTLNAAPGISGRITLYNPSGTTFPKNFTGSVSAAFTGPTNIGANIAGFWNANGAVTGIQILFSSGNITSGTIKIYGRL